MIKNSSDGKWRDRHYIADLNDMINIFKELDRDQQRNPEFSTLTTVQPSGTALNSPASSSARNSPTLGTSSSWVELSCPDPECGEKFRGRRSDAKSNCKRHLEKSRQHNKDYGFKCPEAECAAKPMRDSYNLVSHLKRKHKIDEPQELAKAIKKSKRVEAVSENVRATRPW